MAEEVNPAAFAAALETAIRQKGLPIGRVLMTPDATEIMFFGVLPPSAMGVPKSRLTPQLQPYLDEIKNGLVAIGQSREIANAKNFSIGLKQ